VVLLHSVLHPGTESLGVARGRVSNKVVHHIA
jgi:hypothetical protein